MKTPKQVIRFKVQATENVSFMLEVSVKDLPFKDIESLAREQAIYMQQKGWFKGVDFEGVSFTWYGKIMFTWQGWVK